VPQPICSNIGPVTLWVSFVKVLPSLDSHDDEEIEQPIGGSGESVGRSSDSDRGDFCRVKPGHTQPSDCTKAQHGIWYHDEEHSQEAIEDEQTQYRDGLSCRIPII